MEGRQQLPPPDQQVQPSSETDGQRPEEKIPQDLPASELCDKEVSHQVYANVINAIV